jgi:hypothetical protein
LHPRRTVGGAFHLLCGSCFSAAGDGILSPGHQRLLDCRSVGLQPVADRSGGIAAVDPVRVDGNDAEAAETT